MEHTQGTQQVHTQGHPPKHKWRYYRHLRRLLQQQTQRGGGEAGDPHSHLHPPSRIAASLGSLHTACTSCLTSCALEGHRQDLRQILAPTLALAALTLTTPPSPPPPSPPPPPSRLATLTTTTLALAAPTPQVVAKISVGEAPDLIKLAKTEHLTPIEERIKDLHESMNASQHGSDAPHGQYPDLAPAPLHGAPADHGRLGTPRRRGQPIGRPATARVLELAASHTRRFHAIDPQAVRDMQDQMREQDEVRQ